MPTAEQFTPVFVGAFIARCYERGLTKEATTSLLNAAATIAAHQNQGFAAGFNEKMSEGGLEKSAWALAGKLLTGGLGLGAIGGAGLYGYNKIRDGVRGHNRQAWGDVPMIGGYDPAAAARSEQDRLREASKGIADINRNTDKDGRRLAELQSVVSSGGPGAAVAIAELQRLRSSPYAGQRARYQQDLDNYQTGTAKGLGTVQQDLSELNADRESLWNRARKFIGFPRDFDGEERNLVAQQARLSEQQRLAQRMGERLRSGATSFSDGPMTNEQLQRNFFPTKP